MIYTTTLKPDETVILLIQSTIKHFYQLTFKMATLIKCNLKLFNLNLGIDCTKKKQIKKKN